MAYGDWIDTVLLINTDLPTWAVHGIRCTGNVPRMAHPSIYHNVYTYLPNAMDYAWQLMCGPASMTGDKPLWLQVNGVSVMLSTVCPARDERENAIELADAREAHHAMYRYAQMLATK